MSHHHDVPPADDLRQRIRNGDAAAFEDLYEAHHRSVYHLAYRVTGDRSSAEDVTSETFLAAWRTREALHDGDSAVLPWLLGIASHQAVNATRGVRRRLAFLARRQPPDPVADFADEVAGRLDDARILARTQRALRLLSRSEAEVLALCVGSALDYAGAAQALGVPVGTVRSRLSRARVKLARLVEAEDDEHPSAHPPHPVHRLSTANHSSQEARP